MRILIPLFVCLFFGANPALAQRLPLPAGYHVQEAWSGEPVELRYDYDGDGRQDVFAAIEPGGEGEAKLMLALKGGKALRHSKPLALCCGSISRKKGIIKVQSKGMRAFSYYSFRWDKAAGDLRLIGYDTESFGNSVQDGSGTSSLNLLTGDFAAAFNSWNEKKQKLEPLPRVKRKIKIGRRIYLSDFGNWTDEWLSELCYRHLPKELR